MNKKTFIAFLLVTLIWTIYRYTLKLPVWVEETFIKGLVFSIPLILIPLKTSHILPALGITRQNFFKSVYLGITVGIILGFSGQIGNLIRHGYFNFNSYGLTSATIGNFIILAIITAFWEQLLFTGYFLARLKNTINNETYRVLIVGMGFTLIHLPALIFIQHLGLSAILFSSFLLLSLGVSCAILRLRLNNLIAPIMIHAFWGITIFLFR